MEEGGGGDDEAAVILTTADEDGTTCSFDIAQFRRWLLRVGLTTRKID